ncbi:heterokaryon incompatibility -domain-containing protein [Rutstroemia sp. NJR-2017a BBW]|nr:heterokaryon incompatibility -domain-containing protein [Rutstroemia sp. NJR-2017a BBW]
MSLARSWIHKCARLTDHKACNAQWAPQDFLPTRLIYVGDSTKSNHLRLLLTSTKGPEIEYFVLSHCWGKTEFLTLKKENQKDMLQSIDYDSLPSNFKDAIYFTRKMGFKYLWIDSLCIMQDSKEDWARESKAMCDIYAKAFCTLFSSGSVDAYGGCFHERYPFQYAPCELLSSENEILTCQLRAPNPFLAQVEYAPLNQRAWAFQERILSRRIVHFGTTLLLFECRTQYLSELQGSSLHLGREYVTLDGFHFNNQKFGYLSGNKKMDQKYIYTTSIANPDGRLGRRLSLNAKPNPLYRLGPIRESILSSPVVSNRGAFFALRKDQDAALVYEKPLPLKKQLRLHQNWFQLVEAYTSAKLTHSSDRTIAMLGIALSIKGQRRDIHYFAGLWCHFVIFDLLWCVAETPEQQPKDTRAPSWSWMAVDGKISQRICHSRWPVRRKNIQ